jgi:ATP-binding cassette subfamily B protein
VIKAIKILAGSRIGKLRISTVLHVFQSLLRGAPFGVLLLIIWELFSPSLDTKKVALYIAVMFGILCAHLVIAIIAGTKIFTNAFDMSADARLRLGEHIKKLSLGFFKNRDPGDLTAVLLQDMKNVEQIFTHLYVDMISAIVIPVIILVFLFFVDYRLTLAMLVLVPVAIPMLIFALKLIDYMGRKQIVLKTTANSRMLEYLLGIRVIKAFNMGGEKFTRLDNILKRVRRESLIFEASCGPFVLVYMLILEIGFIAILLLGIRFVFNGSLVIPAFLMFLIVGNRFYDVLQNVGAFLAEMRYLKMSTNRIMNVLDTKPLPEPEDDCEFDDFDIEFDNVTFGYRETSVLKGVSFKCSNKSFTALVGPSGSGKTTITNLIARFWDVTSGEIKIGGKNIKDLKSERLLSYISMVYQDVYLFNDTIYNNIKTGKMDAGRKEVVSAAKISECHDFIEKLPDGYDTIVGEGGLTLSGGEKQRISIARALLKDAPVVLLDEATSSLDPENEMLIQQALGQLNRSKTLIVIAHSLSTIKRADNILVIDKGKVVEQGRHDELVAKGGMYNHLWEMQNSSKGWKIESSPARAHGGTLIV